MADQAWLEQIRSWAGAHPHHCPMCGLPKAYCYDRDPAYREEKLKREGPFDTRAVKEWHSRALRQLPLDVLKALPVPTRKILARLLAEERNRRIKPPSAWERLMGVPIV